LRDEAGPKVTEEAGQDNWQDEDKDMEDGEEVNGFNLSVWRRLRDEAGPKVTEEAGQDNWQDEDMEEYKDVVNGSMVLTSLFDAGWRTRPVPR
jgi:hypothetical protein